MPVTSSGTAQLVAGERERDLGEPTEFAGQIALMGDHAAVDRVRVGRHASSPPVQGSADTGGFDGRRAPLVGESGGAGLVAVLTGVGGITVGLEREEAIADGDHRR